MTPKTTFCHFFIMALIIIIAIVVRVANIETAPPGLYPDEAQNAIDAYHAIAQGEFAWFYPDNNGREGFYINLMAIGFALFGVSTLTIKLPSIIFGILSVVSLYFLTRELFPSRHRVALIAPYLAAVSFWAINFSRIGFRAIAMLPIMIGMYYFLLRGIRTGHYYNYLLAGALCGLGFHTYIAFRITPAILVVLLILLILVERDFIRRYMWAMCGFVATMLLVVAPLLLTFVAHPEYLSARTSDVSVFAPHHHENGLVRAIATTFAASLAKFNIYGDPNWRHGFPPFPMLEPLVGLAFLVGLIAAVRTFCHHLWNRLRRGIHNRNLLTSGLLLAWFFAFLAPEFLTVEGLPHALRSIGVLPVVLTFAALTIDRVISSLSALNTQHKPALSYALAVVSLCFFLYVGVFGVAKYHVFWAARPETHAAFHTSLTSIAREISARPDEHATVIAGPLDRLVIEIYNTTHAHLTLLYDDQLHMIDPSTTLYIPYGDEAMITRIAVQSDHPLVWERISDSMGTTYIKARAITDHHETHPTTHIQVDTSREHTVIIPFPTNLAL